MKNISLGLILIFILACGKKEVTEHVLPLNESGSGASPIEVKLIAQNIEKLSLDDELIIESADFAESKTTTLNVSCEAPGVNQEAKKMRLKRNKRYKLLQVVPTSLISNNKLNFIKSLVCKFSFTYQRNKTKDVGPIAIDNISYSGNLNLRKGTQVFPRDPKDIVLPNQVNEIHSDFPRGRALAATLVCDQFIGRESLSDIRDFQLSQLIYKGINSSNIQVKGMQNCRIVLEALDQSDEIFISRSFLLVLTKLDLSYDFSTNFINMREVSRGSLSLFNLSVFNPNDFPVEVQIDRLPQRFVWQPVYGTKGGPGHLPIFILTANLKPINWRLADANGSSSGAGASFVLGAQQKAKLVGGAQFNFGCGEKLRVSSFGAEQSLIGYLLELDSNSVDIQESLQGAPLARNQFLFENTLRANVVGNKKWIPVDGIEYPQKLVWFSGGISVYKGTDNRGRAVQNCTDY